MAKAVRQQSIRRLLNIILIMMLYIPYTHGENSFTVVADSLTHTPLPGAPVFNRSGKLIGTSGTDGTVACASASDFPLTIRFMGYNDVTIHHIGQDTVFMQEGKALLPEIVVESGRKKMLHILAYAREYSTLSTYTDTVAMFREKLVDYMLPGDNSVRYEGWRNPRVLNSQSYYHFTDSNGLDSVSDRCNNHFTWSDWIGILKPSEIPPGLTVCETGTDTVHGRYSPTEIWIKNGDKVTLDINVLADTASRKWVPNLSSFFKKDIDFEQFRLRYNFSDVTDGVVSPVELAGCSFNIESTGRGHNMFQFHRLNEQYYVTTYTEIYILNREYISVPEAKKWERNRPSGSDIGIYEPQEAPELQPSIRQLIARVESIDHDGVRLSAVPDERLVSKINIRRNFGQAALQRIKGLFGIDQVIGRRKQNRKWNEFKREQAIKNNRRQEKAPD